MFKHRRVCIKSRFAVATIRVYFVCTCVFFFRRHRKQAHSHVREYACSSAVNTPAVVAAKLSGATNTTHTETHTHTSWYQHAKHDMIHDDVVAVLVIYVSEQSAYVFVRTPCTFNGVGRPQRASRHDGCRARLERWHKRSFVRSFGFVCDSDSGTLRRCCHSRLLKGLRCCEGITNKHTYEVNMHTLKFRSERPRPTST